MPEDRLLERLEKLEGIVETTVQMLPPLIQDLSRRIDGLRGEMQGMEAKLEGRIQQAEAKLQGQIQQVETKLEGRIQQVEAKLFSPCPFWAWPWPRTGASTRAGATPRRGLAPGATP